jgi:hypothetical protein
METINESAQLQTDTSREENHKSPLMGRIFYEPIDAKILYDLLDQICLKTEKHYIVNIIAYRKMMFLKLHLPFLNAIVSKYQVSKRFYVTRKLTFRSFITIVKQLCHHNHITTHSNVQYFESEYIINYFVPHKGTYSSHRKTRGLDAHVSIPCDPLP